MIRVDVLEKSLELIASAVLLADIAELEKVSDFFVFPTSFYELNPVNFAISFLIDAVEDFAKLLQMDPLRLHWDARDCRSWLFDLHVL